MNSQQNIQTVKDQWQAMIERGTLPIFELELVNDEYLLVDLSLVNEGVEFSFDTDNLDLRFIGSVIKKSDNTFLIEFDPYIDNLDYYLQGIMDELNEGVLIPNDLLP